MLIQAEVLNYKSVAHADLRFESETVIVGQNGVGKSNLLDAFHFVRDAARDGLDHAVTKRHGITSIRRWSKTRPFNITIRLVFKSNKEYGEYKFTIASKEGDFTVIEEEGAWTSQNPFSRDRKESNKYVTSKFSRIGSNKIEFHIPDGPFSDMKSSSISDSEILLTQFGSSTFNPLNFYFNGLYKEISEFGAYSIYPNKIREPQSISNAEVLADDGTNLASIIRQMRSSGTRSNRESLTSAIRQVVPFVSEIRIAAAGGFYVPVFRVKEDESGYAHDLNMSQISDGTLRMLGMLTAFYQPHAPNKIALEEPEQMIHPGLLPVLMDSARDYLDAGDETRQLFMTTHSPTLLDLFKPSSLIGASFIGGISKFHPLSERQMRVVKDRLYTVGELLMVEGLVA
jgi:predicted ATPase